MCTLTVDTERTSPGFELAIAKHQNLLVLEGSMNIEQAGGASCAPPLVKSPAALTVYETLIGLAAPTRMAPCQPLLHACLCLAKSSTAQWLASTAQWLARHDFSCEKIHCVMLFLLSASRRLLESTRLCWRLGVFAQSDYCYVLLPLSNLICSSRFHQGFARNYPVNSGLEVSKVRVLHHAEKRKPEVHQ